MNDQGASNPYIQGSKIVKERHLRRTEKIANGNKTWVKADAVYAYSSFPAVQYAARKHFTEHKWFSWIKAYIKGGPKLKSIQKVVEVRVERAQKYTFRVEIPCSLRRPLLSNKPMETICGRSHRVWN